MPHTIMIWLVEPDSNPHDDARAPSTDAAPQKFAGVLTPPATTRLSYGIFEEQDELDAALNRLSDSLRLGTPIRVTHGTRTYLIPASRVHYIAAEQVTRPADQS